MGKNYWMVVESLDNHTITRERNFGVIGFGRPFRRRVQRMQQGDMVLFYVSTIHKWTATATIASEHFEDYTPIWRPTARGEQYAFRVSLEPDIRLKEGQYIDALMLAPRLDYVRRWTPEDWPLAFTDRLHLIPQRDFRLIESEMYRVSGRRPGLQAGRQPPPKQRRRRQKRQPQPQPAGAAPRGPTASSDAEQPEGRPDSPSGRSAPAQTNGGADAPAQGTAEHGESAAGRPRFRPERQARSHRREARGPA